MDSACLRSFYDRVYAELQATDPAAAAEMARLRMAPFASDPGQTLCPCRLLACSMKPYGAPNRSYPFGWEERERRPGLHRWYDGGRATGNFVREADKLVQGVLAALSDGTPVRAVPNLYAYFFRAADARQLKSFGLERIDCSAFHREVLEVIDPEVILCIGNGPAPSAFATYSELLDCTTVHELAPSPRVKVKYGTADGRLLIGVPHLSYVRAEAVLPAVRTLLANRSLP